MIAIKDMEMPTEGYIDVRINCNGTASFAIAKNPYFKEVEVVPVPEPHGRLIDADVVVAEIDSAIDNMSYSYLHLPREEQSQMEHGIVFVRDVVCDAPTVIPASEEGEA